MKILEENTKTMPRYSMNLDNNVIIGWNKAIFSINYRSRINITDCIGF